MEFFSSKHFTQPNGICLKYLGKIPFNQKNLFLSLTFYSPLLSSIHFFPSCWFNLKMHLAIVCIVHRRYPQQQQKCYMIKCFLICMRKLHSKPQHYYDIILLRAIFWSTETVYAWSHRPISTSGAVNTLNKCQRSAFNRN